MVNGERDSAARRFGSYVGSTLLDATGFKRAIEVVDEGRLPIDAIGEGAIVFAFPIMRRGSLYTEKKVDASPEGLAWIGFPVSIAAEFAATLGAYLVAKDYGGSFKEGAEIFTGIKAAEIGVTTVGRDIVNQARAKVQSVFGK
jgi:hypothetical protein